MVEALLREHVSDRTQWQRLLKGPPEPQNLADVRDQLLDKSADGLAALQRQFGLQAIQPLPSATPFQVDYPVLEYPTKVKAHNLDKTPQIEGTLVGIKGQYLIMDTGVINVRKYGAYQIELLA